MKPKLFVLSFCLCAILFNSCTEDPKINPEDIVASGSCGENLTWRLMKDSVLSISGSGDMTNYFYDSPTPWYKYLSSINTVVIGDSVTSIGDWAFNSCCLTSVIIPNSVTSIGEDAFSSCVYLASITIPNSVTFIGKGAFYNCQSLTSVSIPNSVTSIGGWAFYQCHALTFVIIPNSVTSIDKYTFTVCRSLTSFTIPNSTTSIGEAAFAECTGLTSLTIPNSVTSIGYGAFRRCSGLTSITCKATTPPSCEQNAFDEIDEDFSIPLYVPQQSINSYREAYVWSDFKNIKAIEQLE